MDNKLTFSSVTGDWGLKGYDIKQVPGPLMGAMCKLRDYEKTGLSPDGVERLKEASRGKRCLHCGKKLMPERAARETESRQKCRTSV